MRRPPAALPFLLVTAFLDILGLGMVVPLAPGLILGLGGGSVTVGLLVALYGLLQWLAAPVLGGLSDRYGRRPVLLVSLGCLGLDYLAFGLTPALWLLFLSRALAGATSGTNLVVNAYVADVTPPERRTRAYGLVSAAFSAGFVAGPAIGGALGGISPRLPFLLAAGLALLNVAYGLLVLPESLPPELRRPVGWRLANPVAAFTRVARRADIGRLVRARLYADVARQVQQVIWVLFATYRFHWSTGQVGAAVAVAALTGAAAQVLLADRCARRLGERRTAVLGFAVWGGTLLLTGFAPDGWLLYPLIAIGSLGGLAGPPLLSWLSRSAGPHEQGTVQGALAGISSLTETVVPVPAAALFAWSAGVSAPGLVFACAAAALVVAITQLLRAR